MSKSQKPTSEPESRDDQQRWKKLCDALAKDVESGKAKEPPMKQKVAKRVKANLRRLAEGHAADIEDQGVPKKDRSRT